MNRTTLITALAAAGIAALAFASPARSPEPRGGSVQDPEYVAPKDPPNVRSATFAVG